MSTFNTPEPISATIELVVADLRIVAGERNTTVVNVRPSDAALEADVRAAEQTRVEYEAGRLLVKAPKPRALGLFGKAGSIDVSVELPAGSDLEGTAAMATVRASGRLGECRIKVSAGDVELEDTGGLDLDSGAGRLSVNRVDGDAAVSTGTGKVRIREITGNGVVKNSNGDNWIGEVRGGLRVSTSNGDIAVDRAHADLTAATANGDIRAGEIVQGVVSLKTAMGAIEIGIRPGSAARLDVNTSFGRVQNLLQSVDGPQGSDRTVEVRAHTGYGDVVIRRSSAPDLDEPAAPTKELK